MSELLNTASKNTQRNGVTMSERPQGDAPDEFTRLRAEVEALKARLAEAKADVCKFRRWHEESKNHLRLANERLTEVEALLREIRPFVGRDVTSIREQVYVLTPLTNRIDATLEGK